MEKKTLLLGFLFLVVAPLCGMAGVAYWYGPAEIAGTDADSTMRENQDVSLENKLPANEADSARPGRVLEADPIVGDGANNGGARNGDGARRGTRQTKKPVEDTITAPKQNAAGGSAEQTAIEPQEKTKQKPAKKTPPANPVATGTSKFIFEKKVTERIDSKSVKVIYPDTIEIEKDGAKVRVRLESVASPRRGQPFHDDARQFVEELLGSSPVVVHQTGTGSRGMIYGYVIVDGKNVGDEMLKHGFGWHYKRASKSEAMAGLESAAKKAKVGLWADENPTPPWEFKK